jgi:hypothetical protein
MVVLGLSAGANRRSGAYFFIRIRVELPDFLPARNGGNRAKAPFLAKDLAGPVFKVTIALFIFTP